MIKVTCAVIIKNGLILAVQRNATQSNPLKWEFPGGKIENGESETDCLLREIQEELEIKVKLDQRLTPVQCNYERNPIELIPYLVTHLSGAIQLQEHIDFKWLLPEELESMDWADADLPVVQEVLNLTSENLIERRV
ncbi:(deoxy)nucleoside triphosphate pyrophosphohydrolase [Litoribacter alkaliphilus]|uniref:8-oxo-dGTP diphosphatase n=1 Tax=Litoribacter ruber TaxID=702568 RepID=A0AAP2G5N2_9BACT|nr:(deoxy)nucleoside triphosphate pyrophosphohydrolase [Litoribacter alkaliphilus]MBS9525261.1 (deoxy)nucleoside triphosphate pyrophosphohydrolase [Litoribacter alkaliphilus]